MLSRKTQNVEEHKCLKVKLRLQNKMPHLYVPKYWFEQGVRYVYVIPGVEDDT